MAFCAHTLGLFHSATSDVAWFVGRECDCVGAPVLVHAHGWLVARTFMSFAALWFLSFALL